MEKVGTKFPAVYGLRPSIAARVIELCPSESFELDDMDGSGVQKISKVLEDRSRRSIG